MDLAELNEASARRRREQDVRFAAATPIEIMAVVDPRGVIGFSDGASVALPYWRQAGEAVQQTELYVSTRPPLANDLGSLRRLLGPTSVVSLRVRLDVAPRENWHPPLWDARLDEIRPVGPDRELEAIAERLRKPMLIEDPFFGSLELDRRHRKLQARRSFAGANTRSVSTPTCSDAPT